MWRYIGFFAGLYFLQGSVLAYIVNFQKPYLASQGVGKESLGLFTSLLLLPFILKVFLGALSDRVPWGKWGARKPYMVLGLSLFVFCYLQMSGVHPGSDFMAFALWAWLASLGLALFDTCADGWAVDVAEEGEQGALQAAMVAGKSLGLIFMSFVFGQLVQSEGYPVIFQSLSGLGFLILVIILATPHDKKVQGLKSKPVESWGLLTKPFYLAFGLFGILYSVSSFGTDGLVTLQLSDQLGVSPEQLGVFGVGRGVGALLGAGSYAWLNRQIGLMRTQILSLIMLGGGCLLPLFHLEVPIAGGLWGFIWGFQETAFVTLAMRYAEGPWSATFFAISMIFSNIGTAVGEAAAAPLIPRFGYEGVFTGFALLAWSCLILVPAMMSPTSRKA